MLDNSIMKTLLKYDFDLFRGDKGIAEYIKGHLKEYYSDIVDAITKEKNDTLDVSCIEMIKNELAVLKKACDEIPEILADYENGHIKDAYIRSGNFFNELKPYLLFPFPWTNGCDDFYRIRKGDFRIKAAADSKKQKRELFHISKKDRSKVGAYRYSLAGLPCLYLASNIDLAWFECNMPKEFSFCHMVATEELKLVDLAQRPVDFLTCIRNSLLRAEQANDENRKTKTYEALIKYIITYPLAAACSVKVKDRSSSFVEEYIFPQLLMRWVQESTDMDGVRYRSALYSSLPKYSNAVNVALPAKAFREDGLDKRLAAIIAVSDIGYLNVNEEFQKTKDELEALKEFKNKLFLFHDDPSVCRCREEFEDLCECIIDTYSALMEGDYTNGKLIFAFVENLKRYVDLLYQSYESKLSEYIQKPYPKEVIDPEIIKDYFDEFYRLATAIFSKKYRAFDGVNDDLGNYELL